MAMKIYVVGAYRFQFEEGSQPEGATEFVVAPPKVEAPKRGLKPKNKQVEPVVDK